MGNRWRWLFGYGEGRGSKSGCEFEEKPAMIASARRGGVKSKWGDVALAVKYVVSDARLKWADAFANVLVVLLVVTMVVVVDLVVSQTPALFLRFAELEVGETDVLLIADVTAMTRELSPADDADIRVAPNFSSVPLMDYTTLEPAILASGGASSSPRWLLPASLSALRPSASSRLAHPFLVTQNASVRLLIYDSDLEQRSSIGRAWDNRKLGELEVHVSDSVLYLLGIEPGAGDRARVRVSVGKILAELGVLENSTLFKDLVADLTGAPTIRIPLPPVATIVLQQLLQQANSSVPQFGQLPGVFTLSDVFTLARDPDVLGDEDPRVQALLAVAELSSSSEADRVSEELLQLSSVSSLPRVRRRDRHRAVRQEELVPDVDVNSTEVVPTDPSELVDVLDGFLEQALLNVNEGFIELDPSVLDELLAVFIDQFDPTLDTSVIVVGGVVGSQGKWASSLGNVLALELNHVSAALTALIESLILRVFRTESTDTSDASGSIGALAALAFARSLGLGLFQLVSKLELRKYAPLVGVQHLDASYRVRSYIGSGSAEVSTRTFAQFTDALAAKYGVDYPVAPVLPLHTLMVESEVLLIYLSQVFWVVLLVLVCLGAVLVYALAQAEIEEKTYEFGMLRALGLRFRSLLMIMVFRGLSTAVPGLLIGLGVSAVAMVAVASAFSQVTEIVIERTIPTSSIILALCVGLLVPLIANIIPTRKALSVSLKDALDATRSAASSVSGDVLMSAKRLDRLGIHWWWFTLGAFLLFSGVLFYYVLPVSFVDDNFRVFFLVMNLSLIMMLLGLSVLVQLLQPALARGILCALLPTRAPKRLAPDVSLRVLVDRHLHSHRVRNGHAALLLTMSVGFIVFAGALIQQQINGVQNGLYEQYGADVVVTSPTASGSFSVRNSSVIQKMDEFLVRSQIAGFVVDYSLVTGPLFDVSLSTSALSSETTKTQVYGIDDAFFSVVKRELLLVRELAALREDAPDLSSEQHLGAVLRSEDTWDLSLIDEKYGDSSRFRSFGDADYSRFREGSPAENSSVDVRTAVVRDGVELGGESGGSSEDGDAAIENARRLVPYFPMYIMISEAGRRAEAIDTAVPLVMASNGWTRDVVARATVLASKVPLFRFSGYESTFPDSPILVHESSLQALLALAKEDEVDSSSPSGLNASESFESSDEVSVEHQEAGNSLDPIAAVLIRVSETTGVELATKRDASRFVSNTMRGIFDSDAVVVNVDEAIASSDALKRGLSILFLVLAIMVDMLCFLMLWSTMRSNVKHNTVEYAVLRSMGLSTRQLLRVYMYESVCLVLSSVALGTVVGVVVGITLALQQVIVDESSFQLNFPWLMYSVLIAICVIVSLASPLLVVHSLAERPLASILRSS
mmetsp:Transcript_11325/g.24389  ORF Transcript_11325/g.24389 Transcript_11325/m.24389 type:complete len:1375 (+) Transcript_11325:14-4138(+)